MGPVGPGQEVQEVWSTLELAQQEFSEKELSYHKVLAGEGCLSGVNGVCCAQSILHDYLRPDSPFKVACCSIFQLQKP